MQCKLKTVLIVVLAVGFITLLGHELKWWGPSHNCSYPKNEYEAYVRVLHRVWVDNPSYVEDVLFETDEFIHLGDVFTFWCDKDSIAYHKNIERQQIEADLYLKHYREPDEISLHP